MARIKSVARANHAEVAISAGAGDTLIITSAIDNLRKGAASQASTGKGPFRDFYEALVAKGMRPEMARLTVARKLAVITLTVWKKGAWATPSGWLYESETQLDGHGVARWSYNLRHNVARQLRPH